jgi:hypothetical protein
MTQPIDPRIEQILTQIEIYQQVAANYGVPTWQALPIASNPAIAFRPNCTQIEPVWQPTDTAWVWVGQTIYTTPGQGSMGQQTALELQAAGVCITGSHAVDVPLVSTDEVFAKFTQARSNAVAQLPSSTTTAPAAPVVDTATVEDSTGFNPVPLVLMALVLVGLGIGAKFLLGKQPRKSAPKGKAVSPQPPAENEGLDDTVQLDYDFEL